MRNGMPSALTLMANFKLGVVRVTRLVLRLRFKNFCLVCILPLFL